MDIIVIACMHILMHTSICKYIHMYIHTCLHKYMHPSNHPYIYTYKSFYVYFSSTHAPQSYAISSSSNLFLLLTSLLFLFYLWDFSQFGYSITLSLNSLTTYFPAALLPQSKFRIFDYQLFSFFCNRIFFL